MTNPMKIKAIAPWAGSKRRLAPRIIELLGPHDCYLEPFVGGCSILPVKPRCGVEVVNDLNPAIVNVLLSVRDHEVEVSRMLSRYEFDKGHFAAALDYLSHGGGEAVAACQLAVWWMGCNGYAGTTRKPSLNVRHSKGGGDPAVRWRSFKASLPALSERLQGVNVSNSDYDAFLDRWRDNPGAAIYVDPPYLAKAITYTHDFDDPHEHIDLAETLNGYRKARVVVSYYDAPILAELYPADRWRRVEVNVSKASASPSGKPVRATELLLVNDVRAPK